MTLAIDPSAGPFLVTSRAQAVDDYFFDVNDASFALKATPAPETTTTSGPEHGSVVLTKRQSIDDASSVAPATFVCTVDGDRRKDARAFSRHYLPRGRRARRSSPA